MKTLSEFLKKEDINIRWFNNQKGKRAFGCEFIKRAMKFQKKKDDEKFKEFIRLLKEEYKIQWDRGNFVLANVQEAIDKLTGELE